MALLNALLAYQEADMEVDKFDAELRDTKEYKRYAKVKNYMAEQRRVLTRMTGGIETRRNQVNIAQEHADLLQQRYEDGLRKYEALDKTNLQEVERFRAYFEQLHSRLAQERREFTEVVNTLNKEDALLNDMRARLARASREYEELKVMLDTLVQEQKPQKEEIEKKAQELAKQVDPELLQRYQVIKKGVSKPIAQVVDNRCTGCNMELSVALLRKLKENDAPVECENCGRLLITIEAED